MLIFRTKIVLVQHLVSSLSLGDCSVHRLREFVHQVGKKDYHNKFCYSHQHMLHVSVVTAHPQAMNAY